MLGRGVDGRRSEGLADRFGPDYDEPIRSSLDWAQRHRDLVARFGRFPYRNRALGRESTAAEAAWLEQGSRFGQ